jgi:cell division protein FtsX
MLILLGLATAAVACGGGGDGGTADELDDLDLPAATTTPTTTACVPGTEVLVFVNPAVAGDRLTEIHEALAAVPGVVGITYVDQQQAYEEFKVLFADSPEMVSAVDPSILPSSFRVTLDDPAGADAVRAAAATLDGVGEVTEGTGVPRSTAPSNC